MELIALVILIWGACIASRSLDTLNTQTNLLQQQILRGQRAYVLVQEVAEGIDLHLVALPEVGRAPLAHFSLRNTGDTPAKDVRVFATLSTTPVVPAPLQPTGNPRQSAATLGADEITKSWQVGLFPNNRAWTKDDDALWQQGAPIYLLVTVTYDTVFEDIEGEQTIYCGFQAGGSNDLRFWPCPPPGNLIR